MDYFVVRITQTAQSRPSEYPGPGFMKKLKSDLSLKMTLWTQPDVVRLKWCFIKRLKSK